MPRCLVTSALLFITFPLPAAEGPDFAREVLPILSDRCFQCHGPDENARKAELRLDTPEGVAEVVTPGKSSKSELVARLVTPHADELMPPPRAKKPLTPGQIETLKRWVDAGAVWGTHWAFTPLKRPAVPTIADSKFPRRNPIDHFIQARLAHEKLTPSPETPRETLIRRVTLDLTGLPPTPAEVADFLADRSPDAYEKLVDRLLASPRYGERMVWDWLDAARYADSNGYQGDQERTMWPWRDWAVKVFNDDLPFDRFTVLQLAGDLLPDATTEQKIATGFLRNHMINGEGGRIPEENRIEYVMDMAETVGTVWLGLTFNCCRCHDHKFDPVKQREYYGMFAFFNQTPITGAGREGQMAPVVELRTPEQTAKIQELAARIRERGTVVEELEQKRFPRPKGKPASDSPHAKELSAEIRDILKLPPHKRDRRRLETLDKQFAKADTEYGKALKSLREAVIAGEDANRAIPRVMVMQDQEKPRETFILDKGLYNKPGEKVPAITPAILPPLPTSAPRNRLALAEWLVSADNPLPARVIVNRFWQQFFGVGLVKTAEDFGIQGERPSHPELLDWLAIEFRDGGWSVKDLVRIIVTSHTYRQTSKFRNSEFGIRNEASSGIPNSELSIPNSTDPENRLLARGPRYRLPSWMLRDQALAVSGLLVETRGGPPVNPYQPPGIWEEATFGQKKYQQDHGDALYRRSLYTFWRRIIGPTVFFDAGARQTCTVKVSHTNTPLHALTTLNDVTYVEAARALAERVLLSGRRSTPDRIDDAFRRVLARTPSGPEREILLAGLTRSRTHYRAVPDAAKQLLAVGESPRDEVLDPAEHAAWTALCLTILNLDETLSKE